MNLNQTAINYSHSTLPDTTKQTNVIVKSRLLVKKCKITKNVQLVVSALKALAEAGT